jgi:protocatechuate 3,4-dioxygenase beta subunit
VDSILAAAGGSPSASVAALAEGAAVNHILTKAKMIAVALLGVAVLGFGVAAMPQDSGDKARRSPDAGDKPRRSPDGDEIRRSPAEGERTITGKVLGPDGKPIVAELIKLQAGTIPAMIGKTNPDGTFAVRLPADKHSFLVARADGLGADFVLVLERTPSEVTLRLPHDNAIRGRVVDTQGKPVAGALVFAQHIDDYGQRGANVFLNHWKTRNPQTGRLFGEKQFATFTTVYITPESQAFFGTKTNADGSFELRGLGAERVVDLLVRGPGMADTSMLIVNRAGFDPAEFNRAAADNYERMMPKPVRIGTKPDHLHGPDVTFVAEQEKLIRGVLRDRDTGKPRAGVTVTFGRISNMELPNHVHVAMTDAAGKFTIRGSRKYGGYVLEVPGDPAGGYLPAQVAASDSAGFEPIDIVIETAKGIILTGKLTDKSTGKPLAGRVYVEPMHDNPNLAKLPTMSRSRSGPESCTAGEDGSFRLVVPPGPAIIMAGLRVSQQEVMYQPVRSDPKYPQYFYDKGGFPMYARASGGFSPIRGCWCKIIEPAAGDKSFTLDIALEPAKRKLVRVVGPDGKPVANCDAVGIIARDMYPVPQESLYVYGLEAGQPRLVVVCDQRTKMVGTIIVKDSDEDPVVTLGPTGVVTGRAVDAGGNPMPGLGVHLRHTGREAERVYDLLHGTPQVVTDANGEFRIEGAVPGHEFRIAFSKGAKNLGPDAAKSPRHVLSKPGETKSLGDIKVGASE